MKRTRIFCEGITDQIFIADCLEVFFGIQLERKIKDNTVKIFSGSHIQIIPIDGCSNLNNPIVIDQLKDNTAEGGHNIVVLDADYPLNKGNNGFTNAQQKLKDIQRSRGIIFSYYLWHNNKDDGEIENLIRKLVPNDKEVIFSCIQNHICCLQKHSHLDLKIEDIKGQISHYLYTIKAETKSHKKDYKISDHWCLDCNNNEDLKKFRNFLSEQFGMLPIE